MWTQQEHQQSCFQCSVLFQQLMGSFVINYDSHENFIFCAHMSKVKNATIVRALDACMQTSISNQSISIIVGQCCLSVIREKNTIQSNIIMIKESIDLILYHN